MSEIDREQVRRVARLARLELSEEEVDRLAGDLERVLSRFRALEEAEDAGASAEEDGPDAGGGGSGLRPDRPDPDPLARGPEELAPEWRDGFFLVPRLEGVSGDGDGSGG